MLSQASLNTSTGGLVTTIERTYELVLENRSSSKINATKNILVETIQVVQECAQFITKYSETTTFCTPPIPVAFMRLIFFFSKGRGLGRVFYRKQRLRLSTITGKRSLSLLRVVPRLRPQKSLKSPIKKPEPVAPVDV